MADKIKKPTPYSDVTPYSDEPQYSDVPPVTNPYHAGYDQTGGQVYVAAPQGTFAMQTTKGQPGISTRSAVVMTNQPQSSVMINRCRGSDLTFPAIVVCFCCCCCTGIPAIIYAMKAQDEYGLGNWDAAESSQRKARGWMIGSVITAVCILVVFVILYFAVFAVSVNNAEKIYILDNLLL